MSILLILCLLSCFSFGESKNEKNYFRSTETTTISEKTIRKSLELTVPLIIQFSGKAKEKEIKQVETITQHSLGHYVGQNSYIFLSKISQVKKLRSLNFVSDVGMMKKSHKYIESKDNELDRKFIEILMEKSIPINSERRAVNEQFAEDLGKKFPSTKSFHISDEKIVVNPNDIDIKRVVEYLSDRPEVHYMSRISLGRKLSNYHMKWIVHTNIPNQFLSKGELYKGSDEVIGIGDSGVDVASCYFYDENNPVLYIDGEDPNKPNYELSKSSHRKIRAYWDFIDRSVGYYSHGTHCSGIIAGKYNGENEKIKKYNGLAENSKIFFVDIGCTKYGGCSCKGVLGCPCDLEKTKTCPSDSHLVFPPTELDKYYFPFPYKSGVRILSNSWGGEAFGYSFSSQEIDKFAHENPDFLPIFAAGNSGNDIGFMSLDSEAESKNCLTVGATRNSVQDFVEIEENFQNYNDWKSKFLYNKWHELNCDLHTCNSKIEDLSNGTRVLCDYLFQGMVNISLFDCCAVNVTYCDWNPGTCGCRLYSSSLGAHAGDYCCKKCRVDDLVDVNKHIKFTESVAYFSSKGPTSDGRIKPDVMAPGYYLLSANSDPTRSKCNEDLGIKHHLLAMAGTSMATPVVAAAAGIVREYLMKERGQTKPSSSLIKAMLISSSEKLLGTFYFAGKYFKFTDPYIFKDKRFTQGFGRVKLANVVLKNNIFFDWKYIETDQYDFYCFKSSNVNYTNVKMTLVWVDPPSLPSKRVHLVNDLNLIVKRGENFIFGNSYDENIIRRDTVNNVNNVEFELDVNERFCVVIEGYNIPIGNQFYSLVVGGENLKNVKCKKKEKELGFLGGKFVKAKNGNIYLTFSLVVLSVIFSVSLTCNVSSLVVFVVYNYFFPKYKQKRREKHVKLSEEMEMEEENSMEEKMEERGEETEKIL